MSNTASSQRVTFIVLRFMRKPILALVSVYAISMVGWVLIPGDIIEFFLVVTVNIIATGLKLGDRSQVGALLLASSLVAVLQLIAASVVWAVAVHVSVDGMTASSVAIIVSLAGGAMVANIISVTIVVTDALILRR